MSDGNTDAINRHLAEREAYDEQRDKEAELHDLRDEVDALAAKLSEVEAMLPRAWKAGVEAATVKAERYTEACQSCGGVGSITLALPTPTSAELLAQLKETE